VAEAVLRLKVGEEVPVGSHALLHHQTLPRVTLHLAVMPRPDANEATESKLEQLDERE
jgi:hypothetical protein